MLQKVLILDDCISFVEELRKSLSLSNYQVFICSDSNTAIDLCLQEKPNLLICDWQLDSGNNGLIITEILKCICDDLKILFISAYNSFDLRENLKNQKNLFFLEKPFSVKKLFETLTAIETQPYIKNNSCLPISIFEINKDLAIPSNQNASSLKISSIPERTLTWKEFEIGNESYKYCFRNVLNKHFIFCIDTKNEMILNDPRYKYFLTGLPSNKNLNHKRMLVIDKLPAIRNLASEIMHENMVFCHTAKSIDEGLEILEKDRSIGAIVIDSSYDQQIIKNFIKNIRQNYEKIKIIGAFASAIPNLNEFNFDNILSKPFTAKNLVQTFFN